MDPSEAAVRTALNAFVFFYGSSDHPFDPSRHRQPHFLSAHETGSAVDPLPPLPPQLPRRTAVPDPSNQTPPPREPTSDDFLELLATQDFSSPSILGQSSSPLPTSSPSRRHPLVNMPPRKRVATGAGAVPVRRSSSGSSSGSSSENSSSSSSNSSSNVSIATPTVAVAANPASLPAQILSGGLPVTADRLQAAQAAQTAQGSPSRLRTSIKRRRSGEPVATDSGNVSSSMSVSTTGATIGSIPPYRGTDGPSSALYTRKRPRRGSMVVLDDDDPFDDDDKVEIINLTNADRPDAEDAEDAEDGEASGAPETVPTEPAAPAAPPPSTKIKLAAFQCVICMDDVTNLTVTHCGHLFCSECLHSSLYIDATRKICPICRQKVELRSSSQAQAKTARSYFPLELKLMTRNRQGKQPAQRP